MKFLCVCLAPAIDATVRLNAWPTDGCVIKNAIDTFAPGGKTVNVARWLAIRNRAGVPDSRTGVPDSRTGVPPVQKEDVPTSLFSNGQDARSTVVCTGLLGEDNAVMFEKELARYGIEDRFIRIPGATRVNEMFVTPQGSFKVNRPANGGCDGFEGFEGCMGFEGFEVVILSGSLPAGWPADTYRVLVEKAMAAGAKVVLDASGAALVEGVKAHPAVIKPNAEECEALVGFVPKTPDEFRRATEALKKVCDTPIISDGGAGCWFDGSFVAAPSVEVLDTTAAGDTLLAEWCWRTWGLPAPRREGTPGTSGAGGLPAPRREGTPGTPGGWAVAAGSAACTMPGGTPPPVELVDALATTTAHP